MKYAVLVALSTSISAAACGQDAKSPPATPVDAPKPAPATVAAPASDPAAIKQAEEVMAAVSKAYKDAKAMTDTMKIKFETPMGPQTQEMKVVIGSGDDAVMMMEGFSMTAVDGKLNIVREDVKDKYFSVPLAGGLLKTVHETFGMEFPLPLHFVLRSDATASEKLTAISMGALGDAKITGYQLGKAEDGSPIHEIAFASDQGKGTAHVSTETKLVRHVTFDITPQPGLEIKASIEMNPKVSDSPTPPIAFAAGSRKAVDTMDELEPTPIKVGDEAPTFALQTLGGETVDLSKMRGKVVVIDFWATWCGPCKRGLPLLQQFATWAETSAPTVKVFAVNVWERTKDADERKKKVSEFWTGAKYTLPTLLDMDDSVIGKYGFGGIPATVIIGPDGKVAAIHEGYNEGMVEELKKDVEAAGKTTG